MGAGRYIRHQPQRGFCIREYYHRLCKCCVVRLNAESSSRPRTPSPLFEGGGEAKITFDSETQWKYSLHTAQCTGYMFPMPLNT